MDHSALSKLLDAIEAELRRLRYLVGNPERITGISSAFGYGQVSFEQWLGQVFLPNERAAIASNNLPHSSQVAAAAVRNLDGVDDADTLLELLSSFDAKINQLGGNASGIPRGA
jgi:uncharacterized protein YqcC (DUF446 family)